MNSNLAIPIPGKGNFYVVDSKSETGIRKVGIHTYQWTQVIDLFRKKGTELAKDEAVVLALANLLSKGVLSPEESTKVSNYLKLKSISYSPSYAAEQLNLTKTKTQKIAAETLPSTKEPVNYLSEYLQQTSPLDKKRLLMLVLGSFCEEKSSLPPLQARRCLNELGTSIEKLPLAVAESLINTAKLDEIIGGKSVTTEITNEPAKATLDVLARLADPSLPSKTLFGLWLQATTQMEPADKGSFFQGLVKNPKILKSICEGEENALDSIIPYVPQKGALVASIINNSSKPSQAVLNSLTDNDKRTCFQEAKSTCKIDALELFKEPPADLVQETVNDLKEDTFKTFLSKTSRHTTRLLEEVTKDAGNRKMLLSQIVASPNVQHEFLAQILQQCPQDELTSALSTLSQNKQISQSLLQLNDPLATSIASSILTAPTTLQKLLNLALTNTQSTLGTKLLSELPKKNPQNFYEVFCSLDADSRKALQTQSFFNGKISDLTFDELQAHTEISKPIVQSLLQGTSLKTILSKEPFRRFISESMQSELLSLLNEKNDRIQSTLQGLPQKLSHAQDKKLFALLWQKQLQYPKSMGLLDNIRKITPEQIQIIITNAQLSPKELSTLLQKMSAEQITSNKSTLHSINPEELVPSILEFTDTAEMKKTFLTYLDLTPEESTLPIWKSLLQQANTPAIKLFLDEKLPTLEKSALSFLITKNEESLLPRILLSLTSQQMVDCSIEIKEKLKLETITGLIPQLAPEKLESFLNALQLAARIPDTKAIWEFLLQHVNDGMTKYTQGLTSDQLTLLLQTIDPSLKSSVYTLIIKEQACNLTPNHLQEYLSSHTLQSLLEEKTSLQPLFNTLKSEPSIINNDQPSLILISNTLLENNLVEQNHFFLQHLRDSFDSSKSFADNLLEVKGQGGSEKLLFQLITTPPSQNKPSTEEQIKEYLSFCHGKGEFAYGFKETPKLFPHNHKDLYTLLEKLGPDMSSLDINLLKELMLYTSKTNIPEALHEPLLGYVLKNPDPLEHEIILDLLSKNISQETLQNWLNKKLSSLSNDGALALVQALNEAKKIDLLDGKTYVTLINKLLEYGPNQVNLPLLETLLSKTSGCAVPDSWEQHFHEIFSKRTPKETFPLFKTIQASRLSGLVEKSAIPLFEKILKATDLANYLSDDSLEILLGFIPIHTTISGADDFHIIQYLHEKNRLDLVDKEKLFSIMQEVILETKVTSKTNLKEIWNTIYPKLTEKNKDLFYSILLESPRAIQNLFHNFTTIDQDLYKSLGLYIKKILQEEEGAKTIQQDVVRLGKSIPEKDFDIVIMNLIDDNRFGKDGTARILFPEAATTASVQKSDMTQQQTFLSEVKKQLKKK